MSAAKFRVGLSADFLTKEGVTADGKLAIKFESVSHGSNVQAPYFLLSPMRLLPPVRSQPP
jgi:hypothetical protein